MMMASSMSLTAERTHLDLHRRSLAGYFVSLLLIISPSISYLLISYMHYFSKNLMCTENIKIMYIKSQNLLSHDLIVFLIDFHSISRHNMMP